MSRRAAPASGGLVYSTEQGRMCPTCRQSVAACVCHLQTAAPAGDGITRVKLETAGRKGKAVTVVRGAPLAADALVALGKDLKARCGVGGTTKDGVIELQGDHVERVLAALQARGLRTKRG